MNTQLSVFAPSAGRLSRPQFSPVGHQGIRGSVAHGATRARSFAATLTGVAYTPRLDHVPAWHRSFLDRLQPTVTRYHE